METSILIILIGVILFFNGKSEPIKLIGIGIFIGGFIQLLSKLLY